MQNTSAIYLITCQRPGALPLYYVGQSVKPGNRWVRHKYHMTKGVHANAHMNNACAKYGIEAFSFEVLERAPVDVIDAIEQWWIDAMVGSARCLNIARDAIAPSRGMKMSKEAIEKAIRNRSTPILTDEQKAAQRAQLAKYHGLPPSEATRAKISASKAGDKNHFFGKSGGKSPVARAIEGVSIHDGSVIRFECVQDARRAGFASGMIYNVMNGKHKQHKGYTWRYAV